MVLFNGKDIRTFLTSFYTKLNEEVERLSDEEIISLDLQEWANYLSDKYRIDPIVLFKENIERKITETKVKKVNPFFC